MDRLARLNGTRLGRDHLSEPACARNFRSFHTQRILVALHLAAAEEILDTIMIDRAAHVQMAEVTERVAVSILRLVGPTCCGFNS